MTRRRLRRGNWSVQELERLRQLLPQRGVEQTATLLRRSADNVRKKAFEVLRVPDRRGPWTDSDDWQLRLGWGALELPLLAPSLGRSIDEVRLRVTQLRGRPRVGEWQRSERLLLKKLFGSRRDEDLVVCLMRSREEIARAAAEMCLAKDKRLRQVEGVHAATSPVHRRMPRWTPAEVARLREIYPHNENLLVARALGRSVTSVANKANQLGIYKSPAVLAAIGRSNIRSRHLPEESKMPSHRPLPAGDADRALELSEGTEPTDS